MARYADIEIWIGETAHGTVRRVVGEDLKVRVNGERHHVRNLLRDGPPHVVVEELPRDIDTAGYE